jgi:hypothetical protein
MTSLTSLHDEPFSETCQARLLNGAFIHILPFSKEFILAASGPRQQKKTRALIGGHGRWLRGRFGTHGCLRGRIHPFPYLG